MRVTILNYGYPLLTDIAPFRAITGGLVGAHWPIGVADRCAAAIVVAAECEPAAARVAAHTRFEQALSWPVVGRAAARAYYDLWARICASH